MPSTDQIMQYAETMFLHAVSRFPIVCLIGPGRAAWWNIAGDFDEVAEKIWQKARNYGIITIKGNEPSTLRKYTDGQ